MGGERCLNRPQRATRGHQVALGKLKPLLQFFKLSISQFLYFNKNKRSKSHLSHKYNIK